MRPDLVLVDYNPPGGIDGLQLTAQMRARTGQPVPAVVLTGDISTRTLRNIIAQQCVQLSKPVKPAALLRIIQHMLVPPVAAQTAEAVAGNPASLVHVVEDDGVARAAICDLLEREGFDARG